MSKAQSQQLRIIGGEWRSRRLKFPALDGLRPTMDRVRETLFNWLQFDIEGARVLDAFAGSGALGFEALSRGAKEVIFLEKHPNAAIQLKEICNYWKPETLRSGPVMRWCGWKKTRNRLIWYSLTHRSIKTC